MECLWCFKTIIPETSWTNFFNTSKPKSLCEACEHQLEKLTGTRCIRCSRNSNKDVCSDCEWWQEHPKKDSIEFNYSIYTYNGFMQDIVTKWKYRGDYSLATVFTDEVIQAFKNKFAFLKKNYVLVPIPLSKERLKERAFNQSKQLTSFLSGETDEILARAHGEKQSKKSRAERMKTPNPFLVTKTINKPVILVDDIYTTGRTLRHAASLLKEHGTPKVYAFTLIRG